MKITLTFTLLTSLVAIAFASSVAYVLADIQDGVNQISAHHNTIAILPDTGRSFLSAFVRLIPMTLPLIIPLYMQTLHSGGGSIIAALNKGTTVTNG